MKLFRVKKQRALTRREIIIQRKQSQSTDSPEAGSFTRSRNLSAKYRKPSPDKSERQEVWDLKRKRRKLAIYLASVALAAIVVLFVLSQFIAEVTVKSNAPGSLNSQKYTRVLESYLKDRPFERLRILLDTDSLQGYFLERAPEVKTVTVSRGDSLTKADLQLTFRKPLVQWSSGGTIYYVDEDGITFEDSYLAKPNLIVSDQSGLPAYAGQEIINRRFLSFLGQTVSRFSENNLAVTEVILPPDTIRQVEVALEGRPYRVKMTIDREATAQVAQTVHAISALDARGLNPEYIDVRVDQSVFYK